MKPILALLIIALALSVTPAKAGVISGIKALPRKAIGFTKKATVSTVEFVADIPEAALIATKATGRGIVRFNDDPRTQAAVRCIGTVTTVAGGWFFIRGALAGI